MTPFSQDTFSALASRLLSYSLQQLYPKAQCLRAYTHPEGFGVEVVFTQEVDRAVLDQALQHLEGVLRDSLPVTTIEMMPRNAAEWFRSQGQTLKADWVDALEVPLVSLLRIGPSFMEVWEEEDYDGETGDVSWVRLLELETVQDAGLAVTRIEGRMFKDRQEMKRFFKRYPKMQEVDHRKLGAEMGCFGDHEWKAPGMAMIQQLISWWQESVVSFGFSLTTYHVEEAQELFEAHYRCVDPEILGPQRFAQCTRLLEPSGTPFARGVFGEGEGHRDCAHVFCEESELHQEVISCLHFIHKSITILGFEFRISWMKPIQKSKKSTQGTSLFDQVLCSALEALSLEAQETEGPSGLTFTLVDSLGREWPGPQLTLSQVVFPETQKKQMQVSCTLFRSVEHFVALMIENKAGKLPLWVAPEHLAVLPVTPEQNAYALSVTAAAQGAGLRVRCDTREKELGAKIHEAEIRRIPHIVVVGPHDEKQGCVSIRACHNRRKQPRVAVKALVEPLQGEVARPIVSRES